MIIFEHLGRGGRGINRTFFGNLSDGAVKGGGGVLWIHTVSATMWRFTLTTPILEASFFAFAKIEGLL